MTEISNIKELLYPIEWFFRFAILDLLLIIVFTINADQYFPELNLFPIAHYVAIIAMFIALVFQFINVWNWVIKKSVYQK